MINYIIVALKRIRRTMPKFYRGKQLGFIYKARATGWHKIPPLSLLPYLTGDTIQVHLSLKPLDKGQEWQTGIIKIEPPDLTEISLAEEKITISLSDYVFPFVENMEYTKESPTPPKYQFPTNKWWSRTLPLNGGVRFGQPRNIKCNLSFQNTEDGVEETAPIHIADIEIVSRASFLVNVIMWAFTTIIAIIALIFRIVCKE